MPLLDALENQAAQGRVLPHRRGRAAPGRAAGPAHATEGPYEAGLGINSQVQLAEAEAILQGRLRLAAMAAGVTLTAPETVFLAADTELAAGASRIGPYVVFGPGVTVAEGALDPARLPSRGWVRIEAGARIGPFTHIRPGPEIDEGARVGNFVEMKKAQVDAGAKANHLGYIGDARVGAKSQHRRRHHHLQLRRRRQVQDRDRRGRVHRLRLGAGGAGDDRRRRLRRLRQHDHPRRAARQRWSIARGRQTDLPEGAVTAPGARAGSSGS